MQPVKSRLATLLAITGLALALPVACGGDTTTPTATQAPTPTTAPTATPTPAPTATPTAAPTATPTPAPTATPTTAPMAPALSLEEYLSVCALIEGQDIDDDTTYGTFSAAIGDVIERMSPLAPPAEIADWHNKTLEILQTFKGLVDTQPEDQVIGIDFFGIVAGLEGLQEEVTQAENELPAEIRRQMVKAGCIEDPGSATPAMEPTAAPSDPDDHGDNIDDATPVTSGEVAEGTVNYIGDSDFFVFQAEEGVVYQINVALGTLPTSALELYNPDGQRMGRGNWDSESGESWIIWKAASTGNHFAEVLAGGGQTDSVGTYTLTVGQSDNTDDHGDDIESATAITVGETVAGAIDYFVSHESGVFDPEEDYFVFQAKEGEVYRMELTLGTLDSSLLTLDDDGDWWERLESVDNLYRESQASQIIWEAPDSGEYYVIVTGSGSPGVYIGSYTLTVEHSGTDEGRGNSALTQLTDNNFELDASPAWSPDGSRIAFISEWGAYQFIYVMNADGSGVIPLTDDSALDDAPGWSPDGSRIAFNSDRDGDSEIYVMNSDGSSVVQLTDNSGADVAPAWSPDGNRIAFYSDRDGDYEIYVMNTDGSGVIQLTHNSDGDGRAAWSPNGAQVAFQSDRDGDHEIYVMNADGSGVIQLTHNSDVDGSAEWSPDGSRIAFNSDRDGDSEIYVMNADGSSVVQLTDNYGADVAPAWSPDGNRIAFHSDRDGDYEIYVIATGS